MEKATRKYYNEFGIMPTPEYLASELNYPLEKVCYLINETPNLDPSSLDVKVNDLDTHGDNEVIDFVEDENTNIEDEVATKQLSKDLMDLLDRVLDERSKNVILYRNGFYDDRVYSLEEIGHKYHLSRERIRQIEKKALGKLEPQSRRYKFKAYLDLFK